MSVETLVIGQIGQLSPRYDIVIPEVSSLRIQGRSLAPNGSGLPRRLKEILRTSASEATP